MDDFADEVDEIKSRINNTKEHLTKRQQSYQQTFNPENLAVVEVMKDLAKFCRARSSTFHTDSRLHALAEGRREVFLRIQNHIGLSNDDLYKLLGGPNG